MPSALVIRTAGTNCDAEMCRAFEMAGARVSLVHLDRLIADPSQMDGYELFGFPGGFSYGDDIASGRIFAMKVRERLYPKLAEALNRQALVIGACNGFQTLVQIGILPGVVPWSPTKAPTQTVALTDNKSGRFCDRWVGMQFERSACVWTQGLSEFVAEEHRGDVLQLPVAHGEGRFVCDHPGTLAALEANGQVVARYTENYNGSENAIAGICDPSGRVFGLMPHPERYLDWTRHPYWTRLSADVRRGPTPGLQMFLNAVEAAKLVAV